MVEKHLIDPQAASLYAKSKVRRDNLAPNISRGIIIVVFTMLIALGWWASITELKEIARAQGEITPTGPLAEIEHAEGGRIAEILVQPGSQVKAGDPIAVLSPNALQSQIDQLSIQRAKLRRDLARYQVMLTDFPRDISTPVGPGQPAEFIELATAQRASFMARKTSQASRIRQFAEAVRLAKLIRDHTDVRLGLSRDREEVIKTLADKGIVSAAELSAQMVETNRIQGELMSADSALQTARAQHQDAKSTYDELILDAREENLAAMDETVAELGQIERQLEESHAQLADLTLRSPTDGVVQTVDGGGVDEVLPPGAPIASVLPTDLDLVAVVELSPRDVGHVVPGEDVVIRITSFDQKKFGTIAGVVESISPTTEANEKDEPYFRVIVRLDDDHMGEGAHRRPLRAGMEANAEIITATRTVAEYLLKPIDATLSRALGER